MVVFLYPATARTQLKEDLREAYEIYAAARCSHRAH